ncbi:dystrophin isoform X7 [Nematostella vectensis]|uniref:dystrophin isoform X7 n=1 Tax=Nematostella vectensis TaxID=45351 RepID=UPI002077218A|nr:dystrophin isoform X7 [Nematostella vectensis]
MYSAQNVESSKQNATLARRYLNVTQREEVHKKAFTKWVNSRLAQADPPIEIKNLDRDFCDGIALLSLLEVLLDIRTQRDAGKTRVHRLNNVQRALQICSEHGIQLFGISASDIVNGTRKTTLGLIWNIILHFQLQNPTKSDSKDFSVERALQEWCQERLERYKDLVTIRDFSKSWRDGLAFNAILHSYRGSLFDFGKIIQQDTFTRLDNAFSTANLVWSVPKLLDPSDVDVEKPDKKMITMYLSCLYEKIIANPHGNLPEGITSSEESIALPSRDAESANQEEAPDDIEGLPVKTKKVLEASPARMEQISPLDINLNNIENINRVDETHHLYSKADNETSAHDKSNANNTQELPLEISTAGPMSQTSTAVTENDRKTDFKDIYQLPTTKADSSAHVTKEKVQVIRTSGGQGISEGSRVTRIITKRTVTTHKVPSFTNPQSTRSNPRVKKKVFYLKKNTPRSSHARSSPQFPPISIEETKTIRINSVSSCTPSTSSVSLDGQATDGKKNRVVVYTLDKLKFGVQDVIRLGRGLVDDGYFDEKTSHGFTRRINILENRLNDLRAHSSKEMARLYDLYVILLRQNIDRIHDWLLRAESRMTLDDGIGPTHDDVLQQQKEHFEFQKDLGVFSSINMIFEIDVEDLLLDKHLSEEVQSASERWAKVFNWAEERKQRLNEVLFDWEQLRNSEREILEWMREREYELEVVGSTDITNGEEVAEHIRVLQDAVDQLNQGGRRLDTLRNISVRLIADAQYSDSVAQRIKSEVQDFDDCWRSALENTTSRIAQLTCARERFLEMSALVQNVKEWLCGVEDILRKSNESTGKQKDEERSCLHEIELKYDQRYEKHLKVDRITQLEAAIAEEIDQPSHDAMHLVTTNLIKRYQEACEGLERRREGLPLPQHDDCCLMKYLKRRIMFGGYPEKFANFFTK